LSNAPTFHIDPARFAADPYSYLTKMRATAPICNIPAPLTDRAFCGLTAMPVASDV
jgi:hypothetical protein